MEIWTGSTNVFICLSLQIFFASLSSYASTNFTKFYICKKNKCHNIFFTFSYMVCVFWLIQISSCVKYMIFLLNFIFWLFGGLMISIGFYAFYEKYQATGWVKVETIYDVVLNISLGI